jgi:MerR family regulatory protein
MESITIGRLARAVGVNLETVRYYERRGLLPKPLAAGQAIASFPWKPSAASGSFGARKNSDLTCRDSRVAFAFASHPLQKVRKCEDEQLRFGISLPPLFGLPRSVFSEPALYAQGPFCVFG